MARSVLAYAALDSSGHLSPFSITRRATGPNDVAFQITHCGICHTDLHQVRNDWNVSVYPMVPGHEIVGIATEIGSNVNRFKVGDRVGVGCVVRSCGECDPCEKLLEQYCPKIVWTSNSVDSDGTVTYGGFSTHMVADQRFVSRIPDNLPSDAAAPLLCAGISVYSPMIYFGMHERGKRFAVVGLGGLGHMAVKFGKAFGLEVTVISTSPKKEEEAKELLGADHFLVSTDQSQMKNAERTIDYIIDTVSVPHALEPLLNLLKVNGKIALVGAPGKFYELRPGAIMNGRRLVGGSIIGGSQETQEMLDFCSKHNITSTIEKIPIDYVNTAMDRLQKSDVKYRFVIDIAESLRE